MSQQSVQAALKTATDTDQLLIAPGALDRAAELFRNTFGAETALLVADENTWAAAGSRCYHVFREAGVPLAEPHIFPGTPVLPPDYTHIETVRELLRTTGAVAVAVGSGTLNDIAKRASHEAGKRYMNVTTAASVDGFTAFGAAIVKDGFKQTLECAAPAAVLADVDVLRAAPRDMTAAGYADLVSEVTAGADWIIADSLGVEPLSEPSWSMVQDELRHWIGRPEKLREGDTEVFSDLFEGLTMNGFAMQAMRSSRPASGTEHLFSHIWEMEHLEVGGRPVSHGFKVAIGTLAATALMEKLFERDPPPLDITRRSAEWIGWEEREAAIRREFAGTPFVDDAVSFSRGKYVEPPELERRLRRLLEVWGDLKAKVHAQLYPYEELSRMLAAAGVPVNLSRVALTRDHVRRTFVRAQMIRPRYTALDLAYETGWLGGLMDEIFADARYLPG